MLQLLFVSWFEICPHVEQEILLTVREIGPILFLLQLHLGVSKDGVGLPPRNDVLWRQVSQFRVQQGGGEDRAFPSL